ncbi:hypothetical protein [Rathayibacter sp. AY1C1]|uniref:hypothetical protein n=1 Tax=Rathayibacter sp. AY1C1 TaxID=2080534 RepID=UPI0015E3C2CF|nr:hypothetical protein [Rathayibacter sp. AY1C1]
MPPVYERPPPRWLRASGSGGLLIEQPSLLLAEPPRGAGASRSTAAEHPHPCRSIEP